ncbi:hypothetical protein HKBW3S03_00036, partial [Candidatus Hakubella thermalkaliphila]
CLEFGKHTHNLNRLIEMGNIALEKAEYKKLDDGTWFAEILL